MRRGLRRFGVVLQMVEDLSDDGGVFDTSNHLDGAATLLAGFDLEHVPSSKADIEAFVTREYRIDCDGPVVSSIGMSLSRPESFSQVIC